MNNPFIADNGQFLPYSYEHMVAVVVSLLIGLGLILYSRKHSSHTQKKQLIIFISLLAAALQLSKVFIKHWRSSFAPLQHPSLYPAFRYIYGEKIFLGHSLLLDHGGHFPVTDNPNSDWILSPLRVPTVLGRSLWFGHCRSFSNICLELPRGKKRYFLCLALDQYSRLFYDPCQYPVEQQLHVHDG